MSSPKETRFAGKTAFSDGGDLDASQSLLDAISKNVIVVSKILDKIAGVLMVSIMSLTVLNIILRTVLNKPILGSYEYVGFLTAIMIGLSLAYCAAQKGHIAVDFIMGHFPAEVQKVVSIFVDVVAISFWSLAAWSLANRAYTLSLRGVVSSTTQVPYYYFMYTIAFGLLVLSLVLLTDFLKSFKKVTLTK